MTLTGQIGLLRHGDTLIEKGIEWATESASYHVVVAVSETTCVSAEPGGARYRAISDYGHIDWSRYGLTNTQQQDIVNAAHTYIGRPYNYAIYPPLLWQRITGNKVDGWVARWLSERPNENCSQLSDDVYNAAGLHLFEDIAEIVTPGDFERLFDRLGFLQAPATTH